MRTVLQSGWGHPHQQRSHSHPISQGVGWLFPFPPCALASRVSVVLGELQIGRGQEEGQAPTQGSGRASVLTHEGGARSPSSRGTDPFQEDEEVGRRDGVSFKFQLSKILSLFLVR